MTCLALGCAVAVLALSGPAWGITPKITEFGVGLNAGSSPFGIAEGPDGSVWFSDRGTTRAIGRINPITHGITEFSTGLNAGSRPWGIAAGPDGNLWFTDNGTTKAIGRITPGGTIIEFSTGLNAGSFPVGIAAGPDGSVWFTDSGPSFRAIGRITPSGTITEFTAGLTASSDPVWITSGPDGNLWFGDQGSNAIGRINPITHAITEFTAGLPAGANPEGIATGADGNLWFADDGAEAIGRATTSGTTTEFSTGLPTNAHSPLGIASGSDGQLWFTDDTASGAIGRISPSKHSISEFSQGLPTGSSPTYIAAGADGNMWFGDEGSGAIGRITLPPAAVTGPASAVGAQSATLGGSLRPRAQATSYRFQYGTTSAYALQTSSVSAGAGVAAVAASTAVSGLTPNTLYHYRLSATNQTGTTLGADRIFRTAPAPPAPPAKASFAGTKSSIRVDRKGRFKFSFHATPGLTGTAVFKSVKKVRLSRRSKKKKRVTLAKKSFRVPASGKVRLRVKLSRKKLRILKLNRKIRTRVTVTLRNAAGLTSRASKKITLKAPKRRHG